MQFRTFIVQDQRYIHPPCQFIPYESLLSAIPNIRLPHFTKHDSPAPTVFCTKAARATPHPPPSPGISSDNLCTREVGPGCSNHPINSTQVPLKSRCSSAMIICLETLACIKPGMASPVLEYCTEPASLAFRARGGMLWMRYRGVSLC